MLLADSLHSRTGKKNRLGIRNQNVDWNRNNLRLLNNIEACGARNSDVSKVCKFM